MTDGGHAGRVVVAIATPLEPALVERVAAVDPRIEVRHAPELLPPVRFPCDHRGVDGFTRPPADERRWWELLAGADVLFGVPGDAPAGLAEVARRCPRVRWIQATSAGASEQFAAADLTPQQRQRLAVTTAVGVHAVPLAEFALLGLLALTKDIGRIHADQRARRWTHYPNRELAGGTLLIVGLGEIGVATAHRARAFGMRVVGVKRHPGGPIPDIDEVHPPAALPDLAPAADAVVLSLPATAETRGLFGRELIARLPSHAIVVNVGRGAVVDEAALVTALREGRLAGAALDVTTVEPLPPDSPLWGLPNVLLTPHTMALSPAENARIVDLFADNLRRFLDRRPLRNLVDPELFY